MNKSEAYKMDGLGNDFIIFDKRKDSLLLTREQIIKISNRNNEEAWLKLKVGQQKNPNKLVETFHGWGYEIVDHCVATNMVSMRGGIVDFFPTHSKEPLRIEFFSDTIESIRYFDLDSQRSTNKREEVTIQKPPVLKNGQNNSTDSSDKQSKVGLTD